jgi:hypothetical protein
MDNKDLPADYVADLKKAYPNDPTRDIPGQSAIKINQPSNLAADLYLESRLVRNIEQSVRAKHTAKCDWEHLELQVIPAIKKAILEDFGQSVTNMATKHMMAVNEPFVLTLSFWSRKRMLKKIDHKIHPDFDRAWEDSASELLSRLPKMLWSLKKVYNSGKAEMLMVAFEWLESVDSAPLHDVLQLVEKAKESGQTS